MQIDMTALARVGAHARLAELAAEMNAIQSAFPELGETPRKRRGRPATNGAVHSAAAEEQVLVKRGRKPMSTAAKKAVGERMKAYWAARKSAAPATTNANATTDDKSAAKGTAKRVMSAAGRARISAAAKKRWRALRKAKKAA